MSRLSTVVLILVLSVPLASHADMVGAPTVIDGDTLELQGRRFDLYGIDAPEIDQTCTAGDKSYPCGIVARAALMDLTAGASVECTVRAREEDGRTLATCLSDGYDLAEGLAHTGWGLADRKVTERYVPTESRARDAGRGLWRGTFTPPWEWRKGRHLDSSPTAGH
ncbi:MAG: thermonuclease family protein [Alphaproteobacteria bacterium]|jgi:endonuclease YncB( thermonuclease family)